MKFRMVGIVVVALLFCCLSASGSVICIDDFSGSEDIITFDSGPAGTFQGPYTLSSTVSDVTFNSFASYDQFSFDYDWNAFSKTPGASQGCAFIDRATVVPSNIMLEFSNPLFRVGMWIQGGNKTTSWEITILDQSDSIIETSIFSYGEGARNYPRPATFVGFESKILISKYRLLKNQLIFSIPE